jgi:hypothetical protein
LPWIATRSPSRRTISPARSTTTPR